MVYSSLIFTFDCFVLDSKVLALGVCQCSFETAMYIFIFLWGPVMEKVILKNGDDESTPYGMLFSIFMVSVMLGSLIFTSFGTKSSLSLKSPILSAPLLLFLVCFSCAVSFFLPFYYGLSEVQSNQYTH